jgi:hypothetical protein
MDSTKTRHSTPQEKRKIRKLNLRLKHLTEERDEAQFLKSEYEIEFHLMASKLRIALGLESAPEEESETPPPDVSQNFDNQFKKQPRPEPLTEEERAKASNRVEEDVRKEIENTASAAPAWMKRVYKQIAMETHPDKVSHRDDLSIFEQAQRVGMFAKARKALVDQDGPTLLQLAEELDVNADVDVGMKIEMLNSKITSLMVDVRKIYRTPSWIWGESYGNPGIRLRLLEGYCKLLKYKVPSKQFLDDFVKSAEDSDAGKE